MGRMQERLFWPRFTLINGICSLDSTFLLSLGAVSTLLLTDPSTAPSFCAHPVDWAPPSVFWWNKEEPVSRFDLCWWNRKEPVSRNTSFGNSETKSSPWPSSHYLRTALMSTPMLYLIILTCKILTNYIQGNHLLTLLATLIQDIFTCRFITLYLQTFDCIAHMQPHFS